MSKSDLNLVLIGHVSSGKSATGNTILGKKVFETNGHTAAVTLKTQVDICEYIDGRTVRVVDTPGVAETRYRSTAKQLKNVMAKTIKYCEEGYHAALLVFRYGFMHEMEKKVAEELIHVFGTTFIQEHCFLIVTFGDNLELEKEENGEDFDEWCKQQDTHFQSLRKLCGERFFLFNNMTATLPEKRERVIQLIDMIREFQLNTGERLTKEKIQSFTYQCSIL